MKTKFAAGKSRLLLFFGALLSARALTVTMAVGEVEDEGIAHAARKGLYTFLEQAGQGLTAESRRVMCDVTEKQMNRLDRGGLFASDMPWPWSWRCSIQGGRGFCGPTARTSFFRPG